MAQKQVEGLAVGEGSTEEQGLEGGLREVGESWVKSARGRGNCLRRGPGAGGCQGGQRGCPRERARGSD